MPSATVKTYKLTVPATTEGIDSYSVTITKGSLGTMPSGWTSGSKVNGITFSLSVPDVPYGSSYLVEYFPSQGYTISKTKDSGNFDRDIACALPTATLKTFNFTINQSANQTITVTTGDGTQHTSSFVANYGTTWTATIAADTGYKAGTLSATSGTVTGDYTLSATEATDPTGQDFLVTINPGAHQQIGVLDYRSGNVYTSSFTVKYGDSIRVLGVEADSGYIAGEISVSGEYSGDLGQLTVLGPVTISASEAKLNTTKPDCVINIVQSAHQTITVRRYHGSTYTDYTSSFTAEYDDIILASVEADTGYEAGKLSFSGSYVDDVQVPGFKRVLGAINISVSDAVAEVVNIPDDYALFRVPSQSELDNGALEDIKCPFTGKYIFVSSGISSLYYGGTMAHYTNWNKTINGEEYGKLTQCVMDGLGNNYCGFYDINGRELVPICRFDVVGGVGDLGFGIYFSADGFVAMGSGTHYSYTPVAGKFVAKVQADNVPLDSNVMSELKSRGGWVKMKVMNPFRTRQ